MICSAHAGPAGVPVWRRVRGGGQPPHEARVRHLARRAQPQGDELRRATALQPGSGKEEERIKPEEKVTLLGYQTRRPCTRAVGTHNASSF